MIVDFHSHYYPPPFLDEVRNGTTGFSLTTDEEGNPVLHSPGDYNVAVPGHRDLAVRDQALEGVGVDVQVVSITAPATSLETPERAPRLAALINDALAGVAESRPGRYVALGTLPMNAPAAAVDELERGITELGMPGFALFSNASGVPLADPRFLPLWERAHAHEAVLFIHPTYPLGVEAMTDYMLMPLVGFTMDTTLAAAHLVFAGIPERFPNIRWVLAHLGGAIPYLAERLDRGYDAFARCRRNLPRPPSSYLEEFWYDTVNFDPGCLRLAIEFAGTERLLAGSDYPHKIGSLDRMVESVRGLDLGRDEESRILGGNARELLGIAS